MKKTPWANAIEKAHQAPSEVIQQVRGAKERVFVSGEEIGWRRAVTYTLLENSRIHGIAPHA